MLGQLWFCAVLFKRNDVRWDDYRLSSEAWLDDDSILGDLLPNQPNVLLVLCRAIVSKMWFL